MEKVMLKVVHPEHQEGVGFGKSEMPNLEKIYAETFGTEADNLRKDLLYICELAICQSPCLRETAIKFREKWNV
jgi:cystathionine beta-lyase family protein involved in aluminum resistance